ncbi:hypothetical protein SAMN05216372_103427 [Pseudomonas straminea]|uniref:Uncharacterized protein n=1 Tax=Pseudomonas straminea TaxID=47882 RepID=A0A1I1UU03_PSEOC|nr:hypothetical protein SAMN05216372_103427 [Pseudomonas straminea]
MASICSELHSLHFMRILSFDAQQGLGKILRQHDSKAFCISAPYPYLQKLNSTSINNLPSYRTAYLYSPDFRISTASTAL